MIRTQKFFAAFAFFSVILCLNFTGITFAKDIAKNTGSTAGKYPDYAYEYLGRDKFENFNRKVFIFNGALNKYAIRPVHIVWSSVMPKYGMDRIQGVTNNVEYPIRLISSIVQRDFKTSKNETVRFLTNTTVGLGGMFDPAKRYLKIEPANENMEQALAKCKIKQGPYLVIPILSSTSPRDIAGRILDTGLNPSSYVGTPVLAMVKAGIMVNRTSFMQPLIKMLEDTYADPYDIAKKLYGIEHHIKAANLDRKEILESSLKELEETEITLSNTDTNLVNVNNAPLISDSNGQGTLIQADKKPAAKEEKDTLQADLVLKDYHPQNPVTDSMRTALFDLPEINKSLWSEFSIWNRCFCKRVKTASVKVFPDGEKYNYRYILQKNKNAPVVIIFPSIGEGIYSYHSVVLAKMFYDAGFSAIIQGSHFQWEFIKSMPKEYKPGLPARDAHYLKQVTSKIIASLEQKHNCNFKEKVVIGTSFGAMTTLFLANEESKENTLNITRYISINPPVSLLYAMRQIDKNSEEWSLIPDSLKEKVALTAAKVIQVTNYHKSPKNKLNKLPFTEEEAKLITGFIMHQKLSDLIFSIENAPSCRRCDIYKTINNTNFADYATKYLLQNNNENINDLDRETSLYSIADFLKTNNNYTIYHTLDDYLVNKQQLKDLKKYTKDNTVLVSNGAHLGFLYRSEFIDSLKKEIASVRTVQ